MEVVVADGADDVEVAGVDLEEEGDPLDPVFAADTRVPGGAAAPEDVGAELGGEPVVAPRIAARLSAPEFVAEDRVEVDAAVERIERKAVRGVKASGDVVLLQGQRGVAAPGGVARDVAHH